LQVFGQPHLEPQEFQVQVGFFEQSLAVLGVLGGDHCLQQVVEVPLDPLAEHEPMITGEAADVVAGPENQVVSLGDHDQFLVFFH